MWYFLPSNDHVNYLCEKIQEIDEDTAEGSVPQQFCHFMDSK